MSSKPSCSFWTKRTVEVNGFDSREGYKDGNDVNIQEKTKKVLVNRKMKDQKDKSSMSLRDPIEWIFSNLTWVRESIKNYEGEHRPSVEVDDVVLSVQPSCESENNFNPEILEIEALAEAYTRDSELGRILCNWKYVFIIKLLPSHEYFRKKKVALGCITRERTMVIDVLPKLNDLMAKLGHSGRIMVPQLYFSCFEEATWLHNPKYALGIDINGYGKGRVTEMLGFEQVRTAMQNLAVLHGSSYTFNKKYGIETQYPILTSRTFELHWHLAPRCFESVTEYLKNIGGHEETVHLIEKGASEALSKLKSKFQNQKDDKLICLCHGDYRFAHFKFPSGNGEGKQLKNQKNEEMMILDWQQVLMMNPVYDVLFFVYTSIPKNLRNSHLQHFLQLYYDTLTSSCPTELFPNYTYEDLCSEVEDKKFFGFVMGICMAHFTLGQAEGKLCSSMNCIPLQKVIQDLVTEAEENGSMKKFFYMENKITPFIMKNVSTEWLQYVFKIHGQMLSPSVEYYVEHFQIPEGSSRRQGYDCDFVDITVTTRNYHFNDSGGILDGVMDHHLMCKTMPRLQIYNTYKKKSGAAKKESTVIFSVIPALNNFLQYRGREKYYFQVPYVYFSKREHSAYVLLVQNYKLTGYTSEDMLHGLNLAQVSAALEFLAKLHAVSYMYHREYDMTKNFPVVGRNKFSEFVQNIMSPSLDTVMLILSQFMTTKQIIMKNKDALLKKVIDQVKAMETTQFTCLCQGDFRNSNLMFKEGERSQRQGLGCDVMVLDWQNVSLRHPVFDLLLFFYTSTTPDFRNHHLIRLLQNYHTQLLSIILDFKEPGTVRYLMRDYSFKEFCREFMKGRLFGFVMGLCVMHICEEYRPVQKASVSQNGCDGVSDRLKQKFLRYLDLFEEAETDGLFGKYFETIGVEAIYCETGDMTP